MIPPEEVRALLGLGLDPAEPGPRAARSDGKLEPPARPCKSCPFGPTPIDLRPGRVAEIAGTVVNGRAHVCHTDRRRLCRGARNLQLTVWHAIGLLAEPTDAALDEAMQCFGLRLNGRGS